MFVCVSWLLGPQGMLRLARPATGCLGLCMHAVNRRARGGARANSLTEPADNELRKKPMYVHAFACQVGKVVNELLKGAIAAAVDGCYRDFHPCAKSARGQRADSGHICKRQTTQHTPSASVH